MFRLIRTAHTSPPRHSASPGSTTLPLPSPMPLALCAVDHDELSPRPSVPFSHYKRRPPPLVFFTPYHSPPLTDHPHSPCPPPPTPGARRAVHRQNWAGARRCWRRR